MRKRRWDEVAGRSILSEHHGAGGIRVGGGEEVENEFRSPITTRKSALFDAMERQLCGSKEVWDQGVVKVGSGRV